MVVEWCSCAKILRPRRIGARLVCAQREKPCNLGLGGRCAGSEGVGFEVKGDDVGPWQCASSADKFKQASKQAKGRDGDKSAATGVKGERL